MAAGHGADRGRRLADPAPPHRQGPARGLGRVRVAGGLRPSGAGAAAAGEPDLRYAGRRGPDRGHAGRCRRPPGDHLRREPPPDGSAPAGPVDRLAQPRQAVPRPPARDRGRRSPPGRDPRPRRLQVLQRRLRPRRRRRPADPAGRPAPGGRRGPRARLPAGRRRVRGAGHRQLGHGRARDRSCLHRPLRVRRGLRDRQFLRLRRDSSGGGRHRRRARAGRQAHVRAEGLASAIHRRRSPGRAAAHPPAPRPRAGRPRRLGRRALGAGRARAGHRGRRAGSAAARRRAARHRQGRHPRRDPREARPAERRGVALHQAAHRAGGAHPLGR